MVETKQGRVGTSEEEKALRAEGQLPASLQLSRNYLGGSHVQSAI
jgi:hypothetical protein